MNHALHFVTALLLAAPMPAGLFAGDLYPVNSKVIANGELIPPEFNLDTIYPLQNCDSTAEYYLGSGLANDTFFMVLEPLAACSVYYVEIQWYDSGAVMAFAADYSAAAEAMFPGGYAPSRGESPVSPIGAWFTGLYPEASSSPGNWELLNLGGREWIVGNPLTNEPALFGVGFIKSGALPHPLADNVTTWTDSIRTWFGGPWMYTYPYPWGAYSTYPGTLIEVMLRAWVSYPWGGNPHINISLSPISPPFKSPPPAAASISISRSPTVRSPRKPSTPGSCCSCPAGHGMGRLWGRSISPCRAEAASPDFAAKTSPAALRRERTPTVAMWATIRPSGTAAVSRLRS